MARERTIKRGDGFVNERPQKDGAVRYQARWHDGTRWRAKTFPSMDEAEDHLRAVGRKRRKGHDIAVSELTVLDVVDDYLERGRSRWKPNTSATYGSIRDQVVDGPMGRRRVSELTPRIMQHWIDTLGTTYSPARIEIIRAVVGGALKEAMRLGVIDHNPIAGVRMPKSRRPDYLTWTRADIARAFAAARPDTMLHTYYTVALSTLMRPGEVRALKWADIDLDAGVLTCRRTITRDEHYRPIVGDSTKTGRSRAIALPAATVRALRTHRAAQTARRLKAAAWHDADLVFDRGNGAPLPQQTVWRRHKELCEREQLPPVRLHDLRHIGATTMLERGVPLKVVSEILGHTSLSTTADIYAHVGDELRRSAADALASVLFDDDDDEDESDEDRFRA